MPRISGHGTFGFKSWAEVSSSLLTLWIVWIGAFSLAALPRFRNLFVGFGADLPHATELVADHARTISAFLFILAIAHLAIYLRHLFSQADDARRLLVASFKANLGAQFVLITAMYAPILKWGA